MPAFSDYTLHENLQKAVEALGFITPTPIQQRVIPLAMEGRDVVGCAATGTGKTAAFLLPIMDALLGMKGPIRTQPFGLVLAPTRELAQQVGQHFAELAQFTKLRAVVVHGGTDIRGEDQQLQDPAHVLIATPGRLLEHLSRGGLTLKRLQFFVIDEADRLLDSGFLPEIRRIVDAIPPQRQTMLFSATMPTEMEQFARELLSKPARVQTEVVAPTALVEEFVYPVPEHQKVALLGRLFEKREGVERVLIFARTRQKAHDIMPLLAQSIGLPTGELHADMSQAERTATLEDFRAGTIQVLCATDVAARGLDIDGLSHVVNYDVPNTPDDYIHRVGRTARAERTGFAYTLVAPRELRLMAQIDAYVRRPIKTRRLADFAYEFPPEKSFDFLGKRRGSALKSINDRGPAAGKKEKPFTKDGRLKREFQEPAPEGEQPRRNERKRAEKRIKNMKLPHQRRNGSG